MRGKRCKNNFRNCQKFLPADMRCSKIATKRRMEWALDGTRIEIPLCAQCAVLYDEAVAEAKWEARVS